MSKRIVILGGGYGGVLTAKKLAKRLKKHPDVEITLIDKRPFHTLLTELHEVAAGRVDEESIKIDYSAIFAGRRVKVVLDTVKDMDLDGKKLVGKQAEYPYDYLVVAAGSKPTCFGVPGAVEYAHHLWSYEEAVALREHILRMFRSASCEPDAALRREYLTFVVIGAGLTGVEMMGELAEWIPELCHKFDIDRGEVRLILCDVLKRIMPVLPEKIAMKAQRRLVKMGVEISLGSGAMEITERNLTLNTANHDVVPTRTVIWNAGVESADIVACMDAEKVGRGRITVNKHLQIPERSEVYVIGDNMFYIPEGEKNPVPQMVENCEQAAPVVVNNILHSLGIKDKPMTYRPQFHGVMVSVGGRYACAHVGLPGRFFSLASFFAMIAKHFINMVYFFQVAGVHKVWRYSLFEIFRVHRRRSIFGGHLANGAPVFWKLPLRLWAGFIWLAQASHKPFTLLETGDKTAIFPITFPGVDAGSAASAVATAADAASAASQVMEEATHASLTGLSWLDGLINWGSNWNAVATPVPKFLQPFVDWSLLTFIKPINEVFQVTMLVLLFLVAGSFLSGTLMPVTTVLSGVICIMIYMSGMAGREIVWLLIAAIALFGNSGMAFGLDYYLMPWLNRGLRKWRFTKKWYLYNE